MRGKTIRKQLRELSRSAWSVVRFSFFKSPVKPAEHELKTAGQKQYIAGEEGARRLIK